jgi:hypothetical protein
MVKSSTDRTDKYNAKFDATVVGARYTATATLAKAKSGLMQAALQGVNSSVRAHLTEAGILPIETVKYQAFGNKLFSICQKFAGYMTTKFLSATAIAQAEIEAAKWNTGYSADVNVLAAIWNDFSDCLGSAPSPFPA